MSWSEARKELGLDAAEEMRVRGEGSGSLLAGMPMSEYTQASLQPCMFCGADPREVGGGRGENMRVVAGVLVMDTVCLNCMDPDEAQEIVAQFEGDDDRD